MAMVTMSMSRDNLVKILQCFQNDRVKRKDRNLIMKSLLDSTETEIDASEYAPKRKNSKTSNDTPTTADSAAAAADDVDSDSVMPPGRPLPDNLDQCCQVVIVGCGEISRLYVHCLVGKENILISGVYDVNKDAATSLCTEINDLQGRVYDGAVPPYLSS